MKRKNFFTVGMTVLLAGVSVFLSACSSSDEDIRLAYYEYKEYTDYNSELFYENSLDTEGADPDVIYISEGEDAGYYYMYITSDELSDSGFLAYKSRDMVDWTCTGVALSSYGEYDEKTGYTTISFAFSNYWAPEVIYDQSTKLYYMFYTANSYDPSFSSSSVYFFGDIAVSQSPAGPFVQYNRYFEKETGYTPKIDEENKLRIYEPLFDFSKMDKDDPLYESETDGYMKVIDLNPFIDPVSGEKYMYFCHDLGKAVAITQSSVYAIRLNNDWTPDYTKVSKLISADDDMGHDLNEGDVNEAPFMVYNAESKLYYLFYSANNYKQKTYAVHLAVGDSPTGNFRKLSKEEGGFVLYAEGDWSWASGTGHCSVVDKDGQSYLFYHAHTDRVNGNSSRGVAMDELNWVKNGNGVLVPVVNGPSYALLPKTTEGHKNIAREATVQASGLKSGSEASYLNDGVIPNHDVAFLKECEFEGGKNGTITLSFDDYREIVAISVFNSRDFDKMFNKITNIEVEFYDETAKKSRTASTGAITFDWDRYYTIDGKVIPCGNISIEFAPLKVKTVKITLAGTDSTYAVPEVYILGK